jgi:shikimate dehydrogenase
MISGKTKICALIGDPVEHSVSPAIHNAAFEKLGLDYVYVPFLVKPEKLTKAVEGLRALNVRGFNVTIPHKVAILPLLDKIDPLAQKIGAVNTGVNNNGKLTGCNTDAEGFLQALLEHDIKTENKKITILGAGGASRAISYILAENGARLTILNRKEHLAKAESIAALIKKDPGADVKVIALDKLSEGLKNADILINTTSVGMSPHFEKSIVPAEFLCNIPVVIDIVYNPAETRLLKEAKAAGVKTIGGLDMLVWQGALAFEKWTGQKAPLEIMKHEAEKMLGKHEN